MKKRTKVVLIIAVIWLVVFAVDIAATRLVGRPFLCVKLFGGDAVFYTGLGYAITISYPLAAGEAQQGPFYSYTFWPFVAGFLILLIFIVVDTIITKRANSKKES